MSLNVYYQSYKGLEDAAKIITTDIVRIHTESLEREMMPLEALESLTKRIQQCRECIEALGKQINEACGNLKAANLQDLQFMTFANLHHAVTRINFDLLSQAERDIKEQISRKNITPA